PNKLFLLSLHVFKVKVEGSKKREKVRMEISLLFPFVFLPSVLISRMNGLAYVLITVDHLYHSLEEHDFVFMCNSLIIFLHLFWTFFLFYKSYFFVKEDFSEGK